MALPTGRRDETGERLVAANRQMASIFFARGQSMEYVRAGSAFRTTRRNRIIETAEVKSVYVDQTGVPHVKFDIELRKPNWPAYREGPRILSLRSFFENYTERVAA